MTAQTKELQKRLDESNSANLDLQAQIDNLNNRIYNCPPKFSLQ